MIDNLIEKAVNLSDEERFDEQVIESGRKSFMFDENESHPLFLISLESAGPPRNTVDSPYLRLTQSELDSTDPEVIASVKARMIGYRMIMAGNMSVKGGVPISNLPIEKEKEEELCKAAETNVAEFFALNNIPPENVKFLSPQGDYRTTHSPMIMANADETLADPDSKIGVYVKEKADFIFSFDMTTAFAVKPGDCPIIYARGEANKVPIQCMIHIPWTGADSKGSEYGGYIDQMFAHFNELGIDISSLRLNISGGARAKSYHYEFPENPLENNPGKELLFKNVKATDKSGYSCNINTPVFVRDQLIKYGIDEYQICQDATDTASQECGYSSNSRAFKNKGIGEPNTRDIVVASPIDYPNLIAA